jgi:hypothetical protein
VVVIYSVDVSVDQTGPGSSCQAMSCVQHGVRAGSELNQPLLNGNRCKIPVLETLAGIWYGGAHGAGPRSAMLSC